MKKLVVAVAATLIAPTACAPLYAAPPSAPAPGQPAKISLEDALTICRVAFSEPETGKALFQRLPESSKPVVAAICIGYAQGVSDALEAVRSQSATQPDPAQGTSI